MSTTASAASGSGESASSISCCSQVRPSASIQPTSLWLYFTGKLALLKAALNQGHLVLVIIAVVNTVIAIYYYLAIVRETFFRDPGDRPALAIDLPTRALCVALVAGILALGVLPEPILAAIKSSL